MKRSLVALVSAFALLMGVAFPMLSIPAKAEHGGITISFVWTNSTTFVPSESNSFFGSRRPTFNLVENAEERFTEGELRLRGINEDENVYFLSQVDFSNSDNCQDDEFILVSIDKETYENFDAESGTISTNDGWGGINSCLPAKMVVHAAESGDITVAADSNSDLDGFASIGDETTDDEEDLSCESKGGPFGWILCSAVRLIGTTFELIDQQLTDLLRFDHEQYANDDLREAHAVFRNLAYSLLIPMMLIMVIATALGFDFISAYTVKTALPRMIIAVIFIGLSFDLMTFVIGFVQVVGDGIQNIILNPFDIDSSTTFVDAVGPSLNNAPGNAGLATAMLYFAGSAALAPGAIAALFTFIGLGVLMLLGVFILLLFRQTMIILLLLVSPLAILPWIFPGRDKLFSLWSKTFWLMIWFYPVIMVAIGVGKAMAKVVAG